MAGGECGGGDVVVVVVVVVDDDSLGMFWSSSLVSSTGTIRYAPGIWISSASDMEAFRGCR